ncbi:MAG: ABC transporter substrate-binding protein [Nitrospira sp.]|nr:ABC transporter substrate-binding protein [Nitrospira sp.]
MQMNLREIRRSLMILALCATCLVALPVIAGAQQPARTVTDMTGRTVALPAHIERVAAVGSVPVIHSFIFTMGKADTIVNGMPLFAQGPRYKFHLRVAPQLAQQPTTQGPGGEPDIERLLALKPQVVFVMDKMLLNLLERKGFTVLFLAWREQSDVRALMRLLGQVFETEAQAEAYLDWFDDIVSRIHTAVADRPAAERPKVLFSSFKSMRSPHLIGDWWISQAGGVSVTAGGRLSEQFDFSIEHVAQWNPDVMIVNDPGEVAQVYADTRLQQVKAVQAKRVFAVPIGAHPWGYRTAEQPLMVVWTAELLYGRGVAGLDLTQETKRFYERFFHVRLTDDDVQHMLRGAP